MRPAIVYKSILNH